MRLAFKLAIWITVGICLVSGFFGYWRIRREAVLFENDIRRDHLRLGRVFKLAATKIWKNNGEKKAIEFVQNANSEYRHIQVRWIDSRTIVGEPSEKLKKGELFSWTVRDDPNEEYVRTLIPISLPSKPLRVIELTESLDEKQVYLRKSLIRILLSIGSAILMTALVSGFFGFWIIGRRVQLLVSKAKELGQGGAPEKMEIRQTDEIGLLAGEFEAMSEQVERSRSLLESMLSEEKASVSSKRQFIEYVVNARDEERSRLARELHDGVGQMLSALTMQFRSLKNGIVDEAARLKMEELHGQLVAATEEIGRMAKGLHPLSLDELGFVQAVQRLRADFSKTYGIPVDIQLSDLDSANRLPPSMETALYRIIQEALSNVAKHSRAESVSVVVQRRPKDVQMIIEDHGRGFDLAQLRDGTKSGIGLASIEERAQMLNGTLTIESSPEQGTSLFIRIPMDGGL